MEPVTQALLGAATAEIVSGRELRGRALGWGAAIGMSPDLDILLGGLHGGYGEWLYHRGTTHSLWFGFVAGPVLGWILWRWRDAGFEQTLPAWIKLAIVALVTHPLLDGFTPYGTQFLAPFVRDRFAWNGVAIVDPFYSIVLGAGVFCAAIRRRPERWRRRRLLAALALSTGYLLAGVGVNAWVLRDLRESLAAEIERTQAGDIERIRAYPTIFQPWLRSFVARTPSAIFVGLHSWQEAGCPAWQRHVRPPPTPALRSLRSSWEGQLLEWFADGDVGYFVSRESPEPDRIRMEDLRYSWASPDARGLWGIEARIGRRGELIGGIERLDRITPDADGYARVGRLLRGRLPEPGDGWHRPAHCGARAGARR